jgi:hypothetical protein
MYRISLVASSVLKYSHNIYAHNFGARHLVWEPSADVEVSLKDVLEETLQHLNTNTGQITGPDCQFLHGLLYARANWGLGWKMDFLFNPLKTEFLLNIYISIQSTIFWYITQ